MDTRFHFISFRNRGNPSSTWHSPLIRHKVGDIFQVQFFLKFCSSNWSTKLKPSEAALVPSFSANIVSIPVNLASTSWNPDSLVLLLNQRHGESSHFPAGHSLWINSVLCIESIKGSVLVFLCLSLYTLVVPLSVCFTALMLSISRVLCSSSFHCVLFSVSALLRKRHMEVEV